MIDKEMAKEYVRNKADKGNFDVEVFGRAYFSESSMEQAYLAGAEQKEKRIEELETQIEKMKGCGNCKHCFISKRSFPECEIRNLFEYQDFPKSCSQWEL